jgi:hypothetical protein
MEMREIEEDSLQFKICHITSLEEQLFGNRLIDYVSFSYSYEDKDIILDLVNNNFNNEAPSYFVFGLSDMEINSIDVLPYGFIKLYLRGFDNNDEVVTVDSGLVFYSNDGKKYFTKSYSSTFNLIN